MADATRDENSQPVLIGVSSVDGETPIEIAVNPVTGALIVEVV